MLPRPNLQLSLIPFCARPILQYVAPHTAIARHPPPTETDQPAWLRQPNFCFSVMTLGGCHSSWKQRVTNSLLVRPAPSTSTPSGTLSAVGHCLPRLPLMFYAQREPPEQLIRRSPTSHNRLWHTALTRRRNPGANSGNSYLFIFQGHGIYS